MLPSNYGYNIVRNLGNGANGAVFEVTKDNEKYAMKVVCNANEYDIQEAEILKDLNHPNIIKYVTSFKQDYFWYGMTLTTVTIVMEYADKGKLSTQNLNWSELMVWEFKAQMGSALSYLHGQQIIHRDLKPANILCVSTRENKILYKVADLGIAKRFDFYSKSTVYANTVVGTPCYMAPEVVNRFTHVGYTCSVDLWSLGAVICFIGNNGIHLFSDQRKVNQPVIDPLPNVFSPRLKSSVLKLLRIDPKERPSADEVYKEAKNAISQLSFTNQSPGILTSSIPSTPSGPFLNPSTGQPFPLPTNQVNQPIGQPTSQPNFFSLTNNPQPTLPIPPNMQHPISGILPGQSTPLPTSQFNHTIHQPTNQPYSFCLTNNPQPTFLPSHQTSHIPYLASQQTSHWLEVPSQKISHILHQTPR